MFVLSFERTHNVLRLDFTGLFTAEDLDGIDPAIVGFLAVEQGPREGVRSLYDMTAVTALAVPSTRFAQRASTPPVGDLVRVVVAPPWAGEEFGISYRTARHLWRHHQPIIVSTLTEAYGVLALVNPRFEPLA